MAIGDGIADAVARMQDLQLVPLSGRPTEVFDPEHAVGPTKHDLQSQWARTRVLYAVAEVYVHCTSRGTTVTSTDDIVLRCSVHLRSIKRLRVGRCTLQFVQKGAT